MYQVIEHYHQKDYRYKSKADKGKTLEETNQKLVAANGSLLQQIPAVADTKPVDETVEEKKTFNFHSVFDKNGNFKNEL